MSSNLSNNWYFIEASTQRTNFLNFSCRSSRGWRIFINWCLNRDDCKNKLKVIIGFRSVNLWGFSCLDPGWFLCLFWSDLCVEFLGSRIWRALGISVIFAELINHVKRDRDTWKPKQTPTKFVPLSDKVTIK